MQVILQRGHLWASNKASENDNCINSVKMRNIYDAVIVKKATWEICTLRHENHIGLQIGTKHPVLTETEIHYKMFISFFSYCWHANL